ncbi:MAG TPA: glycosyltransferase family 39 protein [Planctomycetaceae bacterium]|nr:glycosyltransferase family 39 protein [Planctomycetaceae bacterium]
MAPPPTAPPRPPRFWLLPAVIACAAFVSVVVAIDAAGDYPDAPQGPGLTIDETFNVQEGVRLVEGLKTWILGWVSGQPILGLRELFGDYDDLGPNAPFGYHNPDHPPLGRVWLGLWHNATLGIAPARLHPGPIQFVTSAARVGSAAAFAITVFLCGWTAAVWYGRSAGVVAALSLVFMPRVFGHAHLAALETGVGCIYLVAVLTLARTWTGDPKVASRWAVLAGLALGAAMLTKIQGVLIPVPVAIWALVQWRLRALRPLVIWGCVGLCVFFLFWPWLWSHPVGNFLKYLGRTTNRQTLYLWYLGTRYTDRDHPWHYCLVLFLTTVPLGFQALGGLGIFAGRVRRHFARHEQLVLGAMLFPLCLFTIPRIAVYDGARLFLVVFPLWAILIGRGGSLAWDWLGKRLPRRAALPLAALFLAAQSWALFATWPCFLSSYNLAVGGLSGAHRLGFELDYWGASVTRDFLERTAQSVPDGAEIDIAPVLVDFHLSEMLAQSPVLRRRGIRLHAYDAAAPRHADYLLIFCRLADLSPELQKLAAQRPALVAVERSGVLLAGLYDQRVAKAARRPSE